MYALLAIEAYGFAGGATGEATVRGAYGFVGGGTVLAVEGAYRDVTAGGGGE